MTREQALYYLVSTGLTEEQVMEVVEALEQEPCEDAISRQAVFDVIDDIDKTVCMNEYHVIVDAIDKLPPVKPQPKIGHWIVHPKGIYAHLICDNCLSNAPYDCRTNYCPDCGAKMEVEE